MSPFLADLLAEVSVWGATLLWTLIALLALWDSLRAYRSDRADWAVAKTLGNGRALAAEGRLRTSRWFVLGFASVAVVGLLACSALYFQYFTEVLVRPEPDGSVVTSVIRFLSVLTVFFFWRAKRSNIKMGRRMDAFNRRKGAAERLAVARDDRMRRVEEKLDRAETRQKEIDTKQSVDLKLSKDIRRDQTSMQSRNLRLSEEIREEQTRTREELEEKQGKEVDL